MVSGAKERGLVEHLETLVDGAVNLATGLSNLLKGLFSGGPAILITAATIMASVAIDQFLSIRNVGPG